jgi:hypothetical protein
MPPSRWIVFSARAFEQTVEQLAKMGFESVPPPQHQPG